MASTRCPRSPDRTVAAPRQTQSLAGVSAMPDARTCSSCIPPWMTGSIRANPAVRRLGIKGRASGPHGTRSRSNGCRRSPRPGPRRGGPTDCRTTNHRAKRAAHNTHAPMHCRPMALPRSCRSSSPPSTPTRYPACRAAPSRSPQSCPPVPYAHARRGTTPQSKRSSRSHPRR